MIYSFIDLQEATKRQSMIFMINFFLREATVGCRSAEMNAYSTARLALYLPIVLICLTTHDDIVVAPDDDGEDAIH